MTYLGVRVLEAMGRRRLPNFADVLRERGAVHLIVSEKSGSNGRAASRPIPQFDPFGPAIS